MRRCPDTTIRGAYDVFGRGTHRFRQRHQSRDENDLCGGSHTNDQADRARDPCRNYRQREAPPLPRRALHPAFPRRRSRLCCSRRKDRTRTTDVGLEYRDVSRPTSDLLIPSILRARCAAPWGFQQLLELPQVPPVQRRGGAEDPEGGPGPAQSDPMRRPIPSRALWIHLGSPRASVRLWRKSGPTKELNPSKRAGSAKLEIASAPALIAHLKQLLAPQIWGGHAF